MTMSCFPRAIPAATAAVLAAALLASGPAPAQSLRDEPGGKGAGLGARGDAKPKTKDPSARNLQSISRDDVGAGGGRGGRQTDGNAPQQAGGDRPAEGSGKTPGTPRLRQAQAQAPRAPRTASPTNKFRIASGAESLMLRLAPQGDMYSQDLDVLEGDEFTTDLLVMNPRNKAFDRLRLVIDYNPSYLEPLAVNDAAIAGLVRGTPVTRVDRLLGQVIYEATLDKPLEQFQGPLMFLRWRAKAPVFYAPIGFGRSRDGFTTDIISTGESILGTPFDDMDGTVSVGVRVIPQDPEEAALMQEDPNLYMGSSDRVGGVQLGVIGPTTPVQVGEMVSFDLVLDNSAYSQMDGVSVILQYDPEVLEVFDTDHDNWITLGHNIEDGPFREAFPFDYHLANKVHSARGVVEYRVAAGLPEPFLGASGTFARIHARALKPTAGSTIDFLFSRRLGDRTTQVVFLGQDALGNPNIRNDGTNGATFRVMPATMDAAAAGGR